MSQPEENDERPPLRVLLAVGDPERGRRLRDGLAAAGVTIAGRCLDGPSLADRTDSFEYDAALIASDLHRLSATTLSAIREARLPAVLLAPASDIERFRGLAHLMPADAGADEIARALREAWSRGAIYADRSVPADARESHDATGVSAAEDAGNVIAVVSGKGAPGVTTIAIGLAAALGEGRRRSVLVDADLRGGNVAAYLDLDPRRGLLALTYGADGAPLGGRIEDELQDSAGVAALAGVERSESRSKVSAELLVGVVSALKSRSDHVVVDLGEVISGIAPRAIEAVLRSADSVLLVTRGDLVSLWNARACLRHLQEGVGVATDAIGIVVNRREGRDQYAASEVERGLAAPVLAVVPEDHRAASAAIQHQLPLTAVSGGAARELRALATRLTGDADRAATPARRTGFGRLRRAPAERA